MEGMGLRSVAVLKGGRESEGYKSFREIAPALVRGDESEGYAYLLQLIFEELALDLPGLYGSAGVADLIPVGAATLRHWVEALDAIAKEALRRRRKQKAPQPELRILEPGLRTHHPAECWQLEPDLIEKQGADFHLRAPDEPEARAAFEAAHPELVAAREAMLLELFLVDDLLTGAEGEDEAESVPGDEEDEVAADVTNQPLEETP